MCDVPTASTRENLPSISAEDLHVLCQKAFRLGNRARIKLLQGLLALDQSNLFIKLGYSSIFQYAEVHFGYERSQTYECLRVARKLQELPHTVQCFQEGKISWSKLREVTKIAAEETEEEWLAHAKKHSLARLRAEVKDATKKGRRSPRKNDLGIPNVPVDLTFKLTLEEHNLVEKVFGKIQEELKISLKVETVEPKALFLYMVQILSETDPSGLPGGRVENGDSTISIIYRHCPGCRASHVMTDEGPVEVPPEHVERVEGEAEKIKISPLEEVSARESSAQESEIDRPNTSKLLNKLHLRDNHVCQNPCCRRTVGLQGHHIRYRIRGGKTALFNEILVCRYCHALIHQGLLVVRVDEDGEIHWIRKGDGIDTGLKEEMAECSKVFTVRVESTAVDSERKDLSPEHAKIIEISILAFEKLGCRKGEARERARQGYSRLMKMGIRPTVEEVVRYGFKRAS